MTMDMIEIHLTSAQMNAASVLLGMPILASASHQKGFLVCALSVAEVRKLLNKIDALQADNEFGFDQGDIATFYLNVDSNYDEYETNRIYEANAGISE